MSDRINDPTWRKPDTVTFETATTHTHVVRDGLLQQREEGDERLLWITLFAEGEFVVTYSVDDPIPLPDADYVVDAALEAGIFVPALSERT
jgi:hypothetical protein